MSGRKASEVSSVLNRANKSRNVFDENIIKSLNILKGKTVEYEREYFVVENMSISEFSVDAKKELSNEVEIVLRKYKNVEIINKKNYTSVYNEYKNKNEELDKKVRENDKEVKKIFDSIKGKDWYCDREYRDAEKVEKSYREISNEKNTLENNLNKTNGEIELLKGELQAAKKVKNQINEEIKKILHLFYVLNFEFLFHIQISFLKNFDIFYLIHLYSLILFFHILQFLHLKLFLILLIFVQFQNILLSKISQLYFYQYHLSHYLYTLLQN